MGSFSWTRAEHTTKRANLTDGDKYKILIPLEFGGGYIRDTYFDYGEVFSEYTDGYYMDGEGNKYPQSQFGKADLYGILAYMNGCKDLIPADEKMPKTMYEILKYGNTSMRDNRSEGIDIGCYDGQIDRLKFPLKLVSASYKGTYEECKGRSYGDPNQGFARYYWENVDYQGPLSKLKGAEEE